MWYISKMQIATGELTEPVHSLSQHAYQTMGEGVHCNFVDDLGTCLMTAGPVQMPHNFQALRQPGRVLGLYLDLLTIAFMTIHPCCFQ